MLEYVPQESTSISEIYSDNSIKVLNLFDTESIKKDSKKRKRQPSHIQNKSKQNLGIYHALKKLESEKSLSEKLKDLEKRTKDADKLKDSVIQTNHLLTQILSELKKINKNIVMENRNKLNSQSSASNDDEQNQIFIIDEL